MKKQTAMKPERITKKAIQSVLRTGDRTAIWRMCFHVIGKRPTRNEVYDFVKDYAPTVKIRRTAYDIAYWGINRHRYDSKGGYDFYRDNYRHMAMCKLREEIARGTDNYTKRPIMGKTRLYFASPFFGHDDYNKACMMSIRGNERFCDLICKLADKYIPMHI